MKLSVIIVSWNVRDLLDRCLQSLYRQADEVGSVEVIVVDNNSADGTDAMIEARYPQTTLIKNTMNHGFARANNQGFSRATGELFLALNPDTELVDGCLVNAVAVMTSQPRIGILGVTHRNPDGSLQPSVRRLPTIRAMSLIFLKLAKIFPHAQALQRYYAVDFNYREPAAVEQTAGSFLLMRKIMLDAIGVFDEKFFLWFEEVDLCRRAAAAGWRVWYTPEAKIIHFGGQSFKQALTIRNQLRFFRSCVRYFRKHGIG